MREYMPAEEAQKLAETQVIPKWHQELSDCSICFLLDTENMRAKGKYILAKAQKVPVIWRHLTGHDLVIVISGPAWGKATDAQKLALLDHECCHIVREEDDDGVASYVLVGHDIEEFNDVVRRHGKWLADIDLFVEAVQQSLPLEN